MKGLPLAIAALYRSAGRPREWEESLGRFAREYPETQDLVSRLAEPHPPEDLTFEPDDPLFHLAHTARLHGAWQRADWARGLMVDLVDHLPHACIVLGPDAGVITVNRAGRQLLEAGDGLSLGADGALRAWRPDVTATIRDRVARTLADGSRQVVRVPRPSGQSPYLVMSVGLQAPSMPPPAGRKGVAVFLSDPDVAVPIDEALLRSQYGLTRAEARLASVLVDGRSLEEAADHLCVSVNTVRTHLARIFMKTNTGRQGQLLGVLLSGLASIR